MSWMMHLVRGNLRFRFQYRQVRPQARATAATNNSFAVPDVFPFRSKRTDNSVLMTHRGSPLPPAVVIAIFKSQGGTEE